jgi:hypothetical protein
MALTRRHANLAAAGLLGLPSVMAQAEVQKLRYPAPESPRDTRYDDVVALIGAALQRTEAQFGPALLIPSASPMNPARRVVELDPAHGGLDLLWLPAATQASSPSGALRPIRIDLRRGLLGLRIALIHRERQAEFERVRSLAQLRQLRVGMGTNWSDAQVFQRQDIRVVSGSDYEGLFRMLVARRFDLLPRGVNEVFAEWTQRQAELPDLAVETSLLLHYQWPYWVHVHPRREGLARRLERGLQALLEEGTFDRHLWTWHGAAVRRARLDERHAIALDDSRPLASDLAFWRKPPKEFAA